ncbi:MAG: hypothetical protein KAR08_02505 [Candidatus Heimdallarchaeota archaeon]|nr:hypothetical protein [Candidatus Heimdallarchaeota archaeon]
MKAEYELSKDSNVESLLVKIAENFGTTVKTLEDDITKVIAVPSRIRIIQRVDEAKFVLRVRGASDEDISFLTGILGKPVKISQEKLSLNDFVKEVMSIPEVKTKSKDEVIDILDLDDEEFQGYYKQLERFGKRGRGPQPILDAYEILSK